MHSLFDPQLGIVCTMGELVVEAFYNDSEFFPSLIHSSLNHQRAKVKKNDPNFRIWVHEKSILSISEKSCRFCKELTIHRDSVWNDCCNLWWSDQLMSQDLTKVRNSMNQNDYFSSKESFVSISSNEHRSSLDNLFQHIHRQRYRMNRMSYNSGPNNRKLIQSWSFWWNLRNRYTTIGTKNEPNFLHGHVVGRGDPEHDYIQGVPLLGPVPGESFDLVRGKEKWKSDADLKKVVKSFKNLLNDHIESIQKILNQNNLQLFVVWN